MFFCTFSHCAEPANDNFLIKVTVRTRNGRTEQQDK